MAVWSGPDRRPASRATAQAANAAALRPTGQGGWSPPDGVLVGAARALGPWPACLRPGPPRRTRLDGRPRPGSPQRDGRWSSTPVLRGRFAATGYDHDGAAHALRDLTPREVEVLELVATGLSNAEIAASLHLTEHTVKTHVSRILTKTGLRDRVQAVILAYNTGLASPVAGGG